MPSHRRYPSGFAQLIQSRKQHKFPHPQQTRRAGSAKSAMLQEKVSGGMRVFLTGSRSKRTQRKIQALQKRVNAARALCQNLLKP